VKRKDHSDVLKTRPVTGPGPGVLRTEKTFFRATGTYFGKPSATQFLDKL